MNRPAAAIGPASIPASSPILFHDGCGLCLGIAQTLELSIPGLTVVDLGAHPERKVDAVARGVEQLPSLVIGTKVLPVGPHSHIDHIEEAPACAPA